MNTLLCVVFTVLLSSVYSTYTPAPPAPTQPAPPGPPLGTPGPPMTLPPNTGAPKPPKCNTCDPMQSMPVNGLSFNYQLCNFELKYWLASPLNTPLSLQFIYSPTTSITIECAPDITMTEAGGATIDFIHVREAKCSLLPDMLMMELDLYLPIIHLKGTGAKLAHKLNGQDIVFTF